MGSTGKKCVIVELGGIPTEKGKSAGQAPSGPREARRENAGRIISWHHPQGRVREGGLNGPRRQVVSREVPVVTKPRGIDEGRGENVVPFQGGDVALDRAPDRRGIEAVWRREGRAVIVIGPEQATGIADRVIQPRAEALFV